MKVINDRATNRNTDLLRFFLPDDCFLSSSSVSSDTEDFTALDTFVRSSSSSSSSDSPASSEEKKRRT